MKAKFFSLLLGIFTLSLVGCSKNHNDSTDDDCLWGATYGEVSIHLSIDTTMSVYSRIEYEPDSVASRCTQSHKLRYIVEAYSPNGKMISSIRSFSPDLKMKLPSGRNQIIAWADYVLEDPDRDHYFFTDDFSEMLLWEKELYTGNDSKRIAYSASDIIAVNSKITESKMCLTSPMGVYKLIALDKPSYEVGKIKISYPDGIMAALNLHTDHLNVKWFGVSFLSMPETISAYDILIGSDNVFAEANSTTITARIEVYDTEGKLRSRVKRLSFPMVRGKITEVRAPFFTALEFDPDKPDDPDKPSGGGIGINPDFDEVVEIIVN